LAWHITEQAYLTRFRKLASILSGELPISLYLEFLYSANHADLQILKNIKGAIEVCRP
jgi:26S proteasome regulatory subunit N2